MLISIAKPATVEHDRALCSPTVDQGQGGGMQMEKFTALMSGPNLSAQEQIYYLMHWTPPVTVRCERAKSGIVLQGKMILAYGGRCKH